MEKNRRALRLAGPAAPPALSAAPEPDEERSTAGRKSLYGLFALSGFAGLIYESIWTHYLKLFLGHAAYAQTLVLAIFMGGLAVGSWLAARLAPRRRRLLAAYAVVEASIGVEPTARPPKKIGRAHV